MSLSPFIRTPFTDVTGGMVSHQLLGRCQKEEARYMDCLEVYGLERGKVKCAHLFGDFHECQTMTKQFKRFIAMRDERDRQIAEGGMVSHQLLGKCAKQEMDVMDCLEGYGMDRGLRKCTHFIEEFHECRTLTKQFKRFIALRDERDRQIACGHLKGDDKYVSPRIDSY